MEIKDMSDDRLLNWRRICLAGISATKGERSQGWVKAYKEAAEELKCRQQKREEP